MSEDFTLARYAELLAVMREEGYAFARFTELDAVTGRAVLLRHDVDFDPRFVAPMSALEREAGAVATYCVQPDSENYEVDAPETHTAVRALLADGHELALHFDATRTADDGEVARGAAEQARALSERFGAPVRVVSWHQQGRRGAGHVALPDGLVNTYAPRFFDEIGYVSDSNQHWRGKDLEAILRAGEQRVLQVLTHPMWWRDERVTMLAALEEFARRRGVGVDDILTVEQRALIGA